MRRIMLGLAPATFVVSCAAVGPDYATPPVSLSSVFVNGGSAALTDAAVQRWWNGLNDPLLNDLVDRGLAQNLDIKTARARFRQAEAQLRGSGVASQLRGDLTAQAGRDRDTNADINDTVRSGRMRPSSSTCLAGPVAAERRRRQTSPRRAMTKGRFGSLIWPKSQYAYINARYFQNAAWITRQAIEFAARNPEYRHATAERRGCDLGR